MGAIIARDGTDRWIFVDVMILSKMGYKVHALTGKKDNTDFLKKFASTFAY